MTIPKPTPGKPNCAWCTGLLGKVRDFVKGFGWMHPDCAKAYRRRFPPTERPSTLPKHLR